MTIQSTKISFGSGAEGEAIPGLPFRLLAVADFAARRLAVGEAVQTQLWRIDKERFDETLAALAPRVLIEVPNHLTAGEPTLIVDQTIKRMEDFRPEAVVAAQPACARLLELRTEIARLAGEGLAGEAIAVRIEPVAAQLIDGGHLLEALRGGAGSQPVAPAEAASTPASAPGMRAGGGSILDDLINETDRQKEASAAGGAISSVLGAIAGGKSAGSVAGGAVTAAKAWIDARLARQLDVILHNPAFAALEAAWRGLRFLVERTDFRREIIIEIMPAAKEDLRRLLAEGALADEYDQPGEAPLSAVVVAHEFDRTARDIDLLQELAQAAERIQAPLITEAGDGFFGKPIAGFGSGGSLHDLLSDASYAKWLGLRQSDPGRWLALCTVPMLLRRPWGADGATKGFTYKESVDEGRGEGLCWGPAAWALAACMTASQAREGWPHFISGQRGGGMVENLPLREWEARPGVKAAIALKTGLSDMHAQDLATAGVIALQCAARSDKAYFTYVPSAHAPRRYSDAGAAQDAAMKALLPYQLYAGRVAAWLGRVLAGGAGGAGGEELAATLRRRTLELFAVAGRPAPEECVLVSVTDSPRNPMRWQVTFTIRPTFKLFNLTPTLEMNVEMAK